MCSDIREITLNTNLAGRVRRIPLTSADALMTLFECVVNSLQSIEGRIEADPSFSL